MKTNDASNIRNGNATSLLVSPTITLLAPHNGFFADRRGFMIMSSSEPSLYVTPALLHDKQHYVCSEKFSVTVNCQEISDSFGLELQPSTRNDDDNDDENDHQTETRVIRDAAGHKPAETVLHRSVSGVWTDRTPIYRSLSKMSISHRLTVKSSMSF